MNPSARSRFLSHYLALLAAEVRWTEVGPQTDRPPLPLSRLNRLPGSFVPVLRLGAINEEATRSEETEEFLCQLSLGILREWRAAGLEPSEFQVDFDAPTAALAEYRIRIEAIRRAIAPTPPRAKARTLWELAQLVRLHGLELMGTELDPDWFVYRANFYRPAASSPDRKNESPLAWRTFFRPKRSHQDLSPPAGSSIPLSLYRCRLRLAGQRTPSRRRSSDRPHSLAERTLAHESRPRGRRPLLQGPGPP